MTERSFAPFGVGSYDNPETVRIKKYATGAHFVLEEAQIEPGRTPRELVWTKNKARLYRYEPEKEKRYPVPVLLVYALILRPYILDLVPGNSLIEYLLERGFDVYMLDWGIPGDEDKDMSFEHYVLDYLPHVVRKVLRDSGAEDLTLFGYCQGGTIATMYASLFPERIKNLVLLATPVSFAPEDVRSFVLWTSDRPFDPDLVVDTFGNLPANVFGRRVERTSQVPDPANPRGRVARDLFTDSFLATSKWVDDGVPFPGQAFRCWIRDFYQQNKLAKGDLELRGRRVDLSNIRCSILNIAGTGDLICPLPQAEATMDLVGSEDKEFIAVDAGHVGLMAGPTSKGELWPRIGDWLGPRSG